MQSSPRFCSSYLSSQVGFVWLCFFKKNHEWTRMNSNYCSFLPFSFSQHAERSPQYEKIGSIRRCSGQACFSPPKPLKTTQKNINLYHYWNNGILPILTLVRRFLPDGLALFFQTGFCQTQIHTDLPYEITAFAYLTRWTLLFGPQKHRDTDVITRPEGPWQSLAPLAKKSS